jgi:hypothetical protein
VFQDLMLYFDRTATDGRTLTIFCESAFYKWLLEILPIETFKCCKIVSGLPA